MNAPAAIKATYADYRRVKGRKVLQLILEVPLEQAPQVHEAFGEPLPDGSTWVGVARINPDTKPERKGGPLCKRAAILCNEGGFQRFVAERVAKMAGMANPVSKTDPEDIAVFVRHHCGVESRAELDHDVEAARKFNALDMEYRAWLTVPA